MGRMLLSLSCKPYLTPVLMRTVWPKGFEKPQMLSIPLSCFYFFVTKNVDISILYQHIKRFKEFLMFYDLCFWISKTQVIRCNLRVFHFELFVIFLSVISSCLSLPQVFIKCICLLYILLARQLFFTAAKGMLKSRTDVVLRWF